jgi:hypothetical protein
VPAGHHIVRVGAPNAIGAEQVVDVAAGQRVELDVTVEALPEPLGARGHVVDAQTGTPIAGARVSDVETGTPYDVGSDGSFDVDVWPLGYLIVAPGYRARQFGPYLVDEGKPAIDIDFDVPLEPLDPTFFGGWTQIATLSYVFGDRQEVPDGPSVSFEEDGTTRGLDPWTYWGESVSSTCKILVYPLGLSADNADLLPKVTIDSFRLEGDELFREVAGASEYLVFARGGGGGTGGGGGDGSPCEDACARHGDGCPAEAIGECELDCEDTEGEAADDGCTEAWSAFVACCIAAAPAGCPGGEGGGTPDLDLDDPQICGTSCAGELTAFDGC